MRRRSAAPVAQLGDAPQLVVVEEALAAGDRLVVAAELRGEHVRVDRLLARHPVHRARELGQRAGGHEVGGALQEVGHHPGFAEQHAQQEAHPAALAQVGVVLGARHVELAAGDPPVAHQPRVLALVLAHPLQGGVRVVGGHHRDGPVAAAVGVEHHPRAGRDQLDPVVLPLRRGVAHGVRVVPHPREVRHGSAHALHLLVHGPVGVGVGARQQSLRGAAQLLGRPHAAHEVVVAPDPAGGDHHRLAGAHLVSALLAGPVLSRRAVAFVRLRPVAGASVRPYTVAGTRARPLLLGLRRRPRAERPWFSAPRSTAPLQILIFNAAAHHAALSVGEQPGDARPEADLQVRAARVALDRPPHRLHERLGPCPT